MEESQTNMGCGARVEDGVVANPETSIAGKVWTDSRGNPWLSEEPLTFYRSDCEN